MIFVAVMLAAAVPYDLVSHGHYGEPIIVRYPSLVACQQARVEAMAEWARRLLPAQGITQKQDRDLEWSVVPFCLPAGAVAVWGNTPSGL